MIDVTASWNLMLADEELFADGRRNDDAVNLCCLAKALGKDPMGAFYEQKIHHMANDFRGAAKADDDFETAEVEHMCRVMRYVGNWYLVAGEDIADDFGILSSSYMVDAE